jgi:hypothetical protein
MLPLTVAKPVAKRTYFSREPLGWELLSGSATLPIRLLAWPALLVSQRCSSSAALVAAVRGRRIPRKDIEASTTNVRRRPDSYPKTGPPPDSEGVGRDDTRTRSSPDNVSPPACRPAFRRQAVITPGRRYPDSWCRSPRPLSLRKSGCCFCYGRWAMVIFVRRVVVQSQDRPPACTISGCG